MLNILLGPFHWKRLADVPGAKVFRFNPSPERNKYSRKIDHHRQSQQSRMELGCVSAIDSKGRTIWIADAHRDGKHFVVHADEELTAFPELGPARG
jgi:hypothetical protein